MHLRLWSRRSHTQGAARRAAPRLEQHQGHLEERRLEEDIDGRGEWPASSPNGPWAEDERKSAGMRESREKEQREINFGDNSDEDHWEQKERREQQRGAKQIRTLLGSGNYYYYIIYNGLGNILQI